MDCKKRLHYGEYLAALITKNDVDPLDIFSSDELETLLQTASIRRPSRTLPPNAPLVSYRRRLLEVSLKELILLFVFFSLCCCLEMHAAPADLLLIYCVRLPSLAALHSCSQHYIEYLVQLINFKKIDPLSVFEGSELIAQLRRSAIDIPERLENESDAEFYGRCAQVKKNKFPCIIAITVGLKNWESRCVERGHFVSNHYIVCGYIRSWLYSSNACHYELYF